MFKIIAILCVTAFASTKEILIDSEQYNQTMRWGTYRPNLYFGMRSRDTNTIMSGILWHDLRSLESRPWENIRHACDQSEEVEFAWDKHDGNTFGVQTIKDRKNNAEITIRFLKRNSKSRYGNQWTVRIAGKPLDDSIEFGISMSYYFGFNNVGGEFLSPTIDGDSFAISGSNDSPFTIIGKTIDGPNEPNILMYDVDPANIWQIKDFFQSEIISNAQKVAESSQSPTLRQLFELKNLHESSSSTLALIQNLFYSPFELEYTFADGENAEEYDFQSEFSLKEKEFDTKFESVFGLYQKGFSDEKIRFGKSLISSMMGGIGYFEGDWILDDGMEGVDEDSLQEGDDDDYFSSSEEEIPKITPNPHSVGPSKLFTGVPSRTFFPRGFLWDTGFDLFLIQHFDQDIAKDIISSWMATMDENGWIPREQIFGEEARSKVPQKFQIQYPHYANPPIMVGILRQFLKQDTVDSQAKHSNVDFIQEIYPKFCKLYEWFINTQSGQISSYDYGGSYTIGFKWRGRKGSHILTSGLDDYPRSKTAHLGDLHVDLLSWMAYFANILQETSDYLGLKKESLRFSNDFNAMMKTLQELHWDQNSKSFTDITFNENGNIENVVHKGYVTILPLVLGLIPTDSSALEHTLDLIHDPNELWSKYGICSLSQSDSVYGTGENYWRGPIWMPINYLLLQALETKYMREGPFKSKAALIYKELRTNIIDNVYNVYTSTGYTWEQYSCETGQGQRSRPFTGWTSLDLLIMAEKY